MYISVNSNIKGFSNFQIYHSNQYLKLTNERVDKLNNCQKIVT